MRRTNDQTTFVPARTRAGTGQSLEEVARMRDIERGNTETPGNETIEIEDGFRTRATEQVAVSPIPTRVVSDAQLNGLYRGRVGNRTLEIRVDVTGPMATQMVSGDFTETTGGSVRKAGSFIVDSTNIRISPATLSLEGKGRFSFATTYQKVVITISKTAGSNAMVRFLSETNEPGASYLCTFVSQFFRTIRFEQDCELGVVPFGSFDTDSLPSAGVTGNMTVRDAFKEIGVDLQTDGRINVVQVSDDGPDSVWTNAELHASMLTRFSQWSEFPQRAVWQLIAHEHELGPGLHGIMFNQTRNQRQATAVFHSAIGGATDERLRLQLFTYMHQLGLCLDLPDSWQGMGSPPTSPELTSSVSWMNAPWLYPGGSGGFWSSFPYEFHPTEITQLRHGIGNNLMTGNTVSDPSFDDTETDNTVVEDNSGLEFRLEAYRNYALGEPVVVELRLRSTQTVNRNVHPYLHPNMGLVRMMIRKPGGRIVTYSPLINHHMGGETVPLSANDTPVYESAYIGYGRDGFYFDEVGNYTIKATYRAIDGSLVSSNIVTLRVRNPLTNADEQVADLFLGDEQGTLLYLLGSDAEQLRNGRNAFETVIEKHQDHPLAVYAWFVKGMNLSRDFKTITNTDTKPRLRKVDIEACDRYLTAVADAAEAGRGVDNITLNMAMRKLSVIQRIHVGESTARSTLRRLLRILNSRGINDRVLKNIEESVSMI